MKKQFVAVVLACSLLIGQGVSAQDKSSQLENLLKTVKTKIEIPIDLDTFDYIDSNDTYELIWQSQKRDHVIYVNCSQDGTILSYNHQQYEEDEEDKKATIKNQIDYEQAQKNALDFLKQTVPEYVAELKLEENQCFDRDRDYTFTYRREHQGIAVYGEQVQVNIDRYTGDVTQFFGIHYHANDQFNASSPKLSLEEAEKAYLREIGLPLVYQTYYDYKDKENKAYLAYPIESKKYRGINAATGEGVSRYTETDDGGNIESSSQESAKDSGETTKESLSPAEQEAVEDVKGLLSAETLKSQTAQYFPALENCQIISSNILKSQDTYKVKVTCSMTGKTSDKTRIYFTCDGKTGELISYYDNSEEPAFSLKKTPWSKQKAQSFVSQVLPEKSQYIDSPEEETYIKYEQNFRFQRIYDGTKVLGQSIYLTYNQKLQKVTAFNVSWNSELMLPSKEGILLETEMVKKLGLKTYYMQSDKGQYTLVYTHEHFGDQLGALSGEFVDYKGEPIKEEKGQGYYTDIQGREDEAIIRKLYHNGIYLSNDQLKPDEPITQQEMLHLLVQTFENQNNEPEDDYKRAIADKWLSEEEKAPNKQLTQEEGVKYLIGCTQYQKLADMPDVFQYPFDASKVDKAFEGYVAVAKALGVLKDTKNFEGRKPLSKAKAMVMIYEWLENNE